MEEVFGTFWREVLGEESDSSGDAREEDSGDSVRIVRRASEEETRVWGATSERLRGIDKRTFVGIVKVEEADSAEEQQLVRDLLLSRIGGEERCAVVFGGGKPGGGPGGRSGLLSGEFSSPWRRQA